MGEDATAAPIRRAFDRAERALKAALAMTGQTYVDLADLLHVTPSAVSGRIKSRSITGYQRIATVFPPALLVASDLFQEIANIYRAEHERLVRADLDAASEIAKDLEANLD